MLSICLPTWKAHMTAQQEVSHTLRIAPFRACPSYQRDRVNLPSTMRPRLSRPASSPRVCGLVLIRFDLRCVHQHSCGGALSPTTLTSTTSYSAYDVSTSASCHLPPSSPPPPSPCHIRHHHRHRHRPSHPLHVSPLQEGAGSTRLDAVSKSKEVERWRSWSSTSAIWMQRMHCCMFC